MNDEDKRKKRLELFDIKWMLTLAGAGCIIVLFYLLMSLMLKLGGKQADKIVAEAEGCDDDETRDA